MIVGSAQFRSYPAAFRTQLVITARVGPTGRARQLRGPAQCPDRATDAGAPSAMHGLPVSASTGTAAARAR